ncbi:hypothetical protein ACJIZ3_025282 [Penstemon smallii]|uniref:Rab-GAP TBC domain-containing protein n=1 Tax=Penstemon smallii TaxID=265156 RepID=A0ABD3SWK9_9LAMI
MNDICSPMIILLEHEADAFWCFERAMRRLRENFKCTSTSTGVQSQLSTLAQVIKAINPKLHQHLEDVDGGEYLFTICMLMVLFRREFSFVDAIYLWEVKEHHLLLFKCFTKPASIIPWTFEWLQNNFLYWNVFLLQIDLFLFSILNCQIKKIH